MLVHCASRSCDWSGNYGDLRILCTTLDMACEQTLMDDELSDILTPGYEVPAGTCPICGCFVYVDNGPFRKLDKLKSALSRTPTLDPDEDGDVTVPEALWREIQEALT